MKPSVENSGGRNDAIRKEYEQRKEAEKRALRIVEQLLKDDIDERSFLNSLKLISLEHYHDVVEERSISRQCGYCLCQNKLQKPLKQQYKIIHNKVFDITERKNFCSNQCFSLSKMVSQQISSIPLWLRDASKMSDIKLGSLKQSEKHHGDEVPLRYAISKEELDALSSEESPNTQINQSTVNAPRQTLFVKSKAHEIFSPGQASSHSHLQSVCGILREWLTESSLQHLGLITRVEKQVEVDETKQKGLESKQESLDKQMDNLLKGTVCSTQKSVKPLPDFKSLKSDIQNYEQKVESFFGGPLKITEKPKKDSNQQGGQGQIDPILPMVDCKNQANIRRKIVQEQTSKAVKNLSLPNGFPKHSNLLACHNLVRTFTFTSKNIMLNYLQWPIMSIMILYLLAKIDPDLQEYLESESSTLILNAHLKPYNIDTKQLRETVNTILVEK